MANGKSLSNGYGAAGIIGQTLEEDSKSTLGEIRETKAKSQNKRKQKHLGPLRANRGTIEAHLHTMRSQRRGSTGAPPHDERGRRLKALVWFWLNDETLSANLVYQSDYEIGNTTQSDEAMAKIMTMVMAW